MYLMESEGDRDILMAVMKRLYSENRMTGDQMRDAAQLIDAVLGRLIEVDEDDFK